ncbi:MAG TPA: type II toxin-antitoxin system Phd/YefM family antitoxin [Candidatus Acidoferrales bacterium]|nr:type II toxin-antitoxin system Phd/YefM family antitoxin [Candidatus Acidoferrales bacterium]
METVNIHAAKTHLSQLLARVEAGEEVVLARAGQPIARLVPFIASGAPRRFGGWKGRVSVAKNFDAPLPETMDTAFRGEG